MSWQFPHTKDYKLSSITYTRPIQCTSVRGLFHWLPPVSDSLLVPLQTVPVHFACSLYSACPVNAALYSGYALGPEKKKKLVFTLVFLPIKTFLCHVGSEVVTFCCYVGSSKEVILCGKWWSSNFSSSCGMWSKNFCCYVGIGEVVTFCCYVGIGEVVTFRCYVGSGEVVTFRCYVGSGEVVTFHFHVGKN